MTGPSRKPHLLPRGERIRAPFELRLPPARHQLEWRALDSRDAAQFASLEAQNSGQIASEEAPIPWDVVIAPGPDGEPCTLGGFDQAGVLRAAVALQLWPPAESGTVLVRGVVDPDWAGRGIGRALMAWEEGRARQILAGLPGNGPACLVTYVDETAASHRRLVMAAGFSTWRSYYRLRRDLQAPIPHFDLPDGMLWRAKDQVDPEEVRQVYNVASADGWAPGPMLKGQWDRRWDDYRPEWSRLVVDGSTLEVVGFSLVIQREESWTGQPRQETLIHRLAVAPSHRGRGIGRALISNTLRAVGESGLRFCASLVDPEMPNASTAMHEAFGFSPTGQVIVYTLDL
ncbi:MAG: GNAT family N-acetyltransferase [Micrococcales bacterium]|nr:GNAT family N-acetyltransferase [Micrococcales bacterium]